MLLAAVILGAAFGKSSLRPIALGLGLPPLLLAFWTAPRGDGDGLWILWLPFLAGFIGVIATAAWVGTRVGALLRR